MHSISKLTGHNESSANSSTKNEAYRILNTLNQKRNSSWHIIIRTTNALNKYRILKAVNEKGQVTYKSRPISIIADFSPETRKTRWSWTDVLQTLREHKCQPSQTLNYHRWRKQSVPWQKQNHTISFHESNPSKDNKGITPIQGGKSHPRKSKKVILQKT
jgi:hypothetical protein